MESFFRKKNAIKRWDCERTLNELRRRKPLKTLSISSSSIVNLDFLVEFPELIHLELNQCYKIYDHSPITKLHNLEFLDLSVNQIRNIDVFETITFLPRLKYLKISKSPISWRSNNIHMFVPREILAQLTTKYDSTHGIHSGLKNLRTYFNEIKKGYEFRPTVKILVIGNGGVGKTQLSNRISNGMSFVFNENHDSTHGIIVKDVHLGKVLVRFWDFAGQDIYHSTHRVFMNTKAIYLLVWDVESENCPFHRIGDKSYKNEKIFYWLQYAKNVASKNPIIVAQNKCDYVSDRSVTYLTETKDALLKRYNIFDFCQVSAKTNYNIDVIKYLIKDAFSSDNEFSREMIKKIPRSYVAIQEELNHQEEFNKRKTISFGEFDRICKFCGYTGPASAVLDYLHNTGTIFLIENLDINKVVLNQLWLITAIYEVLDRDGFYYRLGKYKNGILNYSDLEKVWDNYSFAEVQMFINAMIQAELCFVEKDEKNKNHQLLYVIPQLLPDQKTEEIRFKIRNNYNLTVVDRININYFPSIYMHRFIARINSISKVEFAWAWGICFSIGSNKCFVEWEEDSSNLLIKSNSRKLNETVINVFDNVTDNELKAYKKQNFIEDHSKLNESFFSNYRKKQYQQSIFDSVRSKLSEGNIVDAVFTMNRIVEKYDYKESRDNLLILRNRHANIEKANIRGTISYQDYIIEQNKIVESIIEIIKKIEY